MADLNLVKQLRNMTQAGFQDCKVAIEKFNGDLEQASKYLREKGLAKAAKKAGAIAAEGAIIVKNNADYALIIEINCQTDFVTKNNAFITLSDNIATTLLDAEVSRIDQLVDVKLANNESISEACKNLSGKIGEKIIVRRFDKVAKNENQDIGIYQHANKKYGAIVLFANKLDDQLKKQIAMHIVARNPKFIDNNQVDKKWLEDEKQVIHSNSSFGNKPASIVEKILNGKLQKKLAEVCLYNQEFDFQPDITVGQLLKNNNNSIIKFIRYEVGEGIEIIKKDFATEVAEQMSK